MIPPRENDITRVEAFSDAMIAFAATLLVVSLDAPRAAAGDAEAQYRMEPKDAQPKRPLP